MCTALHIFLLYISTLIFPLHISTSYCHVILPRHISSLYSRQIHFGKSLKFANAESRNFLCVGLQLWFISEAEAEKLRLSCEELNLTCGLTLGNPPQVPLSLLIS